MEGAERRKDQLKALAFSVFSQCHQIYLHQTIAKSLTGFGPAAAQDLFLKSRDVRYVLFFKPTFNYVTFYFAVNKQLH